MNDYTLRVKPELNFTNEQLCWIQQEITIAYERGLERGKAEKIKEFRRALGFSK